MENTVKRTRGITKRWDRRKGEIIIIHSDFFDLHNMYISVIKTVHVAVVTGALSIQQKFRFGIQEILRVQWNGSFRLHRPDPSHRVLGHCSCKQDTKEWYWGQQFCQMERDISVRPTEMTRPVKGPPSKLVPNIPVGPNRNGPFHLM